MAKPDKFTLKKFGMTFGKQSVWVVLVDELKEKSLDCWIVFNCKGNFVEAYSGEKHQEVKAKTLVEELDENFNKKGAYYKKAKIILDPLN